MEASINPPWSLLKGETWAHWQKRDVIYRSCAESLSTIYQTLLDLQCLERSDLNDNLTSIMEQYRSHISCTGEFMGVPFNVDQDCHPMVLLREMTRHQKHILLVKMSNMSREYAPTLKRRMKASWCSFVNRLFTLSLCCFTILKPLVDKGICCSDDICLKGCSCCFFFKQRDIRVFLSGSVAAVTEKCEELTLSLFQKASFRKKIDDPDAHPLDVEKKLMCYLRTHCESTIMLLNVLLLVDEFLLLQEWLCLLCFYAYKIEEIRCANLKCECRAPTHCATVCTDKEDSECCWCCVRALLCVICSLLIKLHRRKVILLCWLKGLSKACAEDIAENAVRNEMFNMSGHMDTLRAVILIVLATVDLLKFEECLRKKNTCNKGNGHTSSENSRATGYHLMVPSLKYLRLTADSLLKLGKEGGKCTLLDDLVLWYSGILATMTKLCPDMVMEERYSYEALMKRDKVVVNNLADCNEIAVRNVGEAAKVFTISTASSAVGMVSTLFGRLDTCIRYGTVTSEGSSTGTGNGKDSSTSCSQSRCTCCEYKLSCGANGDMGNNICNALTKMSEILETNGENDFKTCSEAMKQQLQRCKTELKTICCNCESTTVATCTGDCCKEEDVSRFARLVKEMVDTVKTHNIIQCKANGTGNGGGCSGSDTCRCCDASANKLGSEGLEPTVFNILKCILCCKTCCDTSESSQISCILACIFCCVYNKLCKDSKQEKCSKCNALCPAKCCNSSNENSSCTCKCAEVKCCNCEHSKPLAQCCQELCKTESPGIACRSLNCWICFFRCYVLCGGKCGDAAKGENECCPCTENCGKCKKDACGNDCNCVLTNKCKDTTCKCCHLYRLSKSLFLCKSCNCGGSTGNGACQLRVTISCQDNCSCQCKANDCGCCLPVYVEEGSAVPLKENCCGHRLGCTLQIITKDMVALKENVCKLKDRADKICQATTSLTCELNEVNKCLTCFYDVLCYTKYGVCHMQNTLTCKLKKLLERVNTNFPCFATEIQGIATRDANMMTKMFKLFVLCLTMAYEGILLVQRIVGMCGKINLLKHRIKNTNDDICNIKRDVDRNWRSLLNLKGGAISAHEGRCSVVQLSALGGERVTAIGARFPDGRSRMSMGFKADLEQDIYSSSGLGILKYIWVLLSVYVFIKYSPWFGMYTNREGSVALVTTYTALTAFHLTVAVRGFGLQTIAATRGGGSAGTYINLIMLAGLAVTLILSWVTNMANVYVVTVKSLNYVNERMRTVGIYETSASRGRNVLFKTVRQTVESDIKSVLRMCKMTSAPQPDLVSGFKPEWLPSNVEDPYGLSMSTFGLSEECSAKEFLQKLRDYCFGSLYWVLDAIGFLTIHPDNCGFLDRTKHRSQTNIAIPLLWAAWSNNTQITDSAMRLCMICKKVLLTLNEEYLNHADDIEESGRRTNMMNVWNGFYETQLKILPEMCIKYRVRTAIYTESQRTFLKEMFSSYYADAWETYHTGLSKFAKSYMPLSGSVDELEEVHGGSKCEVALDSLKWLGENALEDHVVENYNHVMYWSNTSAGYSENDDSEMPSRFQHINDKAAFTKGANKWMKRKLKLCEMSGTDKDECMHAVQFVMSKAKDVLKYVQKGDNIVEVLYYSGCVQNVDYQKVDDGTQGKMDLDVVRLLKKSGDLKYQRDSFMSNMQTSGTGSRDVSEKFKDQIKALKESDENHGNWWRVLYWLGTWSVFNPVPVSGRDVSYLLM
ncbi:hypothetical protein BgAZ_105650 [Babesia gibsoni]|uniref:Uncharacterized protein n=1 Tax=Babesia gibsoni TaxID=33632 RepID=A0AAD8UW21_BABGI|nr:hypothetical protein BgAZ_105650 [Babesia gibsoni]